jgi:hypothetical protein
MSQGWDVNGQGANPIEDSTALALSCVLSCLLALGSAFHDRL